MFGYYILIGAITLVSWLVSNHLKKKFAKYSKVQLRNGLSGREIAEKMLADNGIFDVEVISNVVMPYNMRKLIVHWVCVLHSCQ